MGRSVRVVVTFVAMLGIACAPFAGTTTGGGKSDGTPSTNEPTPEAGNLATEGGSEAGGEAGADGAVVVDAASEVPGPPPIDVDTSLVVPDVAEGSYIVQCSSTNDKNERVWNVQTSGPTATTRWAVFYGPELTTLECGPPVAGVFPVVFKGSASIPSDTTILQCPEVDGGAGRVFATTGATNAQGYYYAIYEGTTATPPTGCPGG